MNKITLMDGAVGTSLWAKAESKGIAKVPVWKYNIDAPEIVEELAKEYIAAGSQMILTNTFGANAPSVKRSSDYNPDDIVRNGVKITKKAVEGTDVKVVLAAGPLSVLLEPYGDLEGDEAREIYQQLIGVGMEEKPDMILLQTFMDIEMMRIAAEVAKQYSVPVLCSMTFEQKGKTMMGNSVDDVIEKLSPLGIDGVGINCSLGPDLALPVIKEFKEKTDIPLIFKPNAGKPIMGADGSVVSDYTAEMFAKEVEPALEFCNYVGGCCGCDPTYIAAIKKLLK